MFAVLSNVLEHVVDPVGLLGQIRDILRPGGRSGFPAPMATACGGGSSDVIG